MRFVEGRIKFVEGAVVSLSVRLCHLETPEPVLHDAAGLREPAQKR